MGVKLTSCQSMSPTESISCKGTSVFQDNLLRLNLFLHTDLHPLTFLSSRTLLGPTLPGRNRDTVRQKKVYKVFVDELLRRFLFRATYPLLSLFTR